MPVYFHKEDRDVPALDKLKIAGAVKELCLKHGMKTGNINYIYCSDEYLLELNRDYLGHDYYTDIISFNYCENNVVAGDIFMSLDRIEDNASLLGENTEEEIIRVCGHGVFHLLGYNDETDQEKEIMRQKEDEFIKMVKA